MSIKVTESDSSREIVIQVNGRFDFTCHQAFSEAYKGYPRHEKFFVVDLANTDYMDSSALGMLLQLKEHASGRAPVSLMQPNPAVLELLKISNFDKLFDIG